MSGLASWLSRWVREATGSLPDCPQRGINETICPNNFIFSGILHFFEKLNENQYAPQIIKKLVNWCTMIINCWQPSSKDSGLEVRFSLWKREVTGSINGCPKLGIIELIGPNNSISWVIFHLLRNYLKNSLQTRLEKNINWSTTIIKCWQPSLLEGERSSVMVIALGARGHGFTPRLSPTRDKWNNLSQQFHILRNIAFFWEIKWKSVCTTDY